MMPMGLTSTRFLSYHDINVKNEDLYEDAFRFNCDFNDVINLLGKVKYNLEDDVSERLIRKLKEHGC
jgi:hypothetical protein